MKLGVIVLAHRGPTQVAQLLAAVGEDPRTRIYLHVDKRADRSSFAREFSGVRADNLVHLPRRAAYWGGIELVDAIIDWVAGAVADGCDYSILLSGQDFPLRPMKEIVDFFDSEPSRSYVKYWELPTRRWRLGGRDRTDFYTYTMFGRRETCFPRGEDISFLNSKGRALNQLLRLRSRRKGPRKFPDYARPFGGWVWWNLSGSAMRYVLAFLERHPDYRLYHEHTLSADEVFFHSILLGSDFAERHEIVNDDLRYAIWEDGESHPRILTEDDLAPMLESSKLFARKFDSNIDNRVLSLIAAAI